MQGQAAAPNTVSYTTNTLNQYLKVGSPISFTYDSAGNLRSDGSATFLYDSENRLTSASTGSVSNTYAHDAQGRRKSKNLNGVKTVFVTDTDNREVLEYDGTSGAIQRWYAYALGPNDVLNQMNVTSGTRVTPVPDIIGSIIGSQDSSSGALTKVGYLPYGKSASTGPFGFTGQRIDPEIGAIDPIGNLYYYRARHYSPAWGRFLQPDPIGYAGGANLYAYVGNDPLNNTDPTGNDPVIGALVGLIAGGFYGGLSAYANPGRSFQSVLAGAGAGAVVGAGVGLFDPSLGAGTLAVIGGLAGGAGDLAAQFVTNSYTGKTIGDVNFGSTLGAVAGGAISGAGGSVLGSLAVKAGVSEFAATVFGASISAGPGALLPLVGGALSESNNSASEGQNSAEGAAQPNSLPTSSASAAQVPSK